MPIGALALVLTAAVIHAIWNLAVKQAKEKQIILLWGVFIGVILYSPVFFFSESMPARAWPYILASGLMEALYYIALTWAYTIDDFSVVYPIARGAAPVLLVIWTTL